MTDTKNEVAADVKVLIAQARYKARPLVSNVTGERSRAASIAITKLDEALLWLDAYERGGTP